MPETSKRENQISWACRILITFDMLENLAGYISFFNTKNQLVSPLIPNSTVYQIFADGGDSIMKSSMISAAIFIVGLWFYSFNKKILAIAFFAAAPICFK